MRGRHHLTAMGVLMALPVVASAGIEGANAPIQVTMTTAQAVRHDTSPPLREMLLQFQAPPPSNPTEYVVPNRILDVDDLFASLPLRAPGNVQRAPLGLATPPVDVAVNGMRIGLGGGGVPPDTTGDVGPNHYFQWVNTSWALFDKNTGALVDIPGDADDVVPGNSFWAGFGGLCQTQNRGDPLVLWDGHARRWLVSQFGFAGGGNTPPFFQCVAVSTSEDPLGSYHRYAFEYPVFNDYGKMGVWVTEDGGQNAYLFTQHEFGASFQGTSFAVLERDRMLNGEPAQFIRFAGFTDAFGALPFHLEGDVAMPAGACPVFGHFLFNGSGYRFWDLCVDWAAGTGQLDAQPTIVPSDSFLVGLNGIPQADSTTRLDDFGSNSMYLAALRSFGPTGPLDAYAVLTHAVNVGNDNQAGVRWAHFGFRTGVSDPGENLFASSFETGESSPSTAVVTTKRLIDAGTYAPDADSRWMSGINIDRVGNIAVGYNVASSALNPEVRIAARLRDDPQGQLRNESQCSPVGTGAQTGLFGGRARWGDYASMGVDPNDECTFWFTNEYYVTTSNSSWNTRICSMQLPGCTDSDFALEVTPPGIIPACLLDPAPVIDVRVAEFGDIGANVSLSTFSAPAGVTLQYSPATLAPGESSSVTLNGFDVQANGVYQVVILGDSGSAQRNVVVEVGVSANTAAAPSLQNPPAAATGVLPRPTYSWTGTAPEYFIEIATDAGFANVVDSAVVTGTSYDSGILLDPSTQYFWRVTARNFCGDGGVASGSFTTGVPGQCPAGSTPATVFEDDFQSGTNGWTTNAPVGPSNWAQGTPPGATGLTGTVWFATNPPNPASANSSDQRLVSPAIALPATSDNLFLRYDAFHSFEQDGPTGCWDAGQLEISTDDGNSWTQILDDQLFTDPYTGIITANPENPNSGTPGWCVAVGGTSVVSIVDLNAFTGQNVRFRYRVVTDGNTAGAAPNGFFIDNVEVVNCD